MLLFSFTIFNEKGAVYFAVDANIFVLHHFLLDYIRLYLLDTSNDPFFKRKVDTNVCTNAIKK